MNDDIDRINAEIDRLALHTADPRPMELFVERERLRKRAQMWTLGGGAIAVLAGVLAFFVFFANNDYGVPEAGAVAVAVFFPIATIARRDLNAKIGDWIVRAKQVVGK
jgi:peptidoglycan/LPS O-acetylase OafA/YrhL